MPVELPEKLRSYKSWVFDCDGVLLNSNGVKTEAFRVAVLDYGEGPAESLVEYHVKHGGISRFKKFNYFFEKILNRQPKDGEMEEVLDRFSIATTGGLLKCAEADGLRDLLVSIPADIPKIVASGGMQEELRSVFAKRGLDTFFTAIYGSPDTKETILTRERKHGVISDPALYVGDSRYDYEAATACGLDFIFVYGWTEFEDWRNYFAEKKIYAIEKISTLGERFENHG